MQTSTAKLLSPPTVAQAIIDLMDRGTTADAATRTLAAAHGRGMTPAHAAGHAASALPEDSRHRDELDALIAEESFDARTHAA